MGLLTDPSAGQSKLVKFLIGHYTKLCVLLYIAGVAGFCLLAYRPLNSETYFSENALLPGLVRSEFKDSNTARTYYEELVDEMEKRNDDKMPYSWLLAKLRQIGLDTYTHNFTVNYPFGKQQKFRGKNVYGIMRATQTASTESLVLTVPYRPPTSVHETTTAGIAVMLAFAKFASREKYWAKDIIFLVTEHEQLGIHAWLEAYHGISTGKPGVLDAGDMRGRAGAIQAALNLELHSPDITEIDLKIEGLNGQLPNLDLFNLVTRMCLKENVPHTFKRRFNRRYPDPVRDWKYMFGTLMAMSATQATGVPNGNHGLFYRFGIHAVTLEGFEVEPRSKVSFQTVGRILEGTFRSLNNLLEKLHQSFFFYLLPSSDRYISIGLYIPAIISLVSALFLKGYAEWCRLNNVEEEDESKEVEVEEAKSNKTKSSGDQAALTKDSFTVEEWKRILRKEFDALIMQEEQEIRIGYVCTVFIVAHTIGFGLKEMPAYFVMIGALFGYNAEDSLFLGLAIVSLLTIIVPLPVKRPTYASVMIVNVIALLEFGNLLLCVAMYNISFAMFCAAIYVPFSLLMRPTRCRVCSFLQRTLWILLHPFILTIGVVCAYTVLLFPNEGLSELLHRAIGATKQAVLFSVVDSMVYGNWMYSVICTIFVSNWVCFWYMSQYRPTIEDLEIKTEKIQVKKKIE